MDDIRSETITLKACGIRRGFVAGEQFLRISSDGIKDFNALEFRQNGL